MSGSERDKASLFDLAVLFLKLGTIAFGGPAVHIAMMQEDVVSRKRWLTKEEFLDLLGMTNLIPGPNSTEMAIHVGRREQGFAGLIVAGSCFILPSMLLVLGLAWAYVTYGSLPEASGILYGVKPVIIAVVLQAVWGLSRTAIKDSLLALVGILAIIAGFLGINELALLIAGGAVVCIARIAFTRPKTLLSILGPSPFALLFQVSTASGTGVSLWQLFFFFLKVGSILYGSGYVLIAFLRADLVQRWQWLTEAQLIDSIAIGQLTPGPLSTTATFIGYVLAGMPGAIIATLGIFIPSFFFVAVSAPLVSRIRKSKAAGAFLDGVNVASLALMSVVTYQLGRAALVDWATIGLAILSGVLLLGFKINSAWIVLGGAAVGLLLKSLV